MKAIRCIRFALILLTALTLPEGLFCFFSQPFLQPEKQEANSVGEDTRLSILRAQDERIWEQLNEGQALFDQMKWDEAYALLAPIYSKTVQNSFPVACSPPARKQISFQLAGKLAQCQIEKGRYDQVLNLLSPLPLEDYIFSGKETHTSAEQLLFLQAFAAFGLKNFSQAKETLRVLNSLFPDPNKQVGYKAYQLLSTIALQEGHTHLSLLSAETALSLADSKEEENESHFTIALSSFLEGDIEKLKNAAQKVGDTKQQILCSGLLTVMQGKTSEAIPILDSCIDLYPQSPGIQNIFAQNILAKAYAQCGIGLFFNQPSKARVLFLQALTLASPVQKDPENPFFLPSYDLDALDLLHTVIEPLLNSPLQHARRLKQQLDALVAYLRILHGIENDLDFPAVRIEFDPFIQHLDIHLALRANRYFEAYTSFINLRSAAPDYEALYHAWFYVANALLDSPDQNQLGQIGLELMTDLAEQKVTASPYAILAQLTLLQRHPHPLLPDPAMISIPEDFFRLGLSELMLVQSYLEEAESRVDPHEVESAIDKALYFAAQSQSHLLESLQGSLHAPSVHLARLHACSFELKALTKRALRMKSCSLEKERLTSLAISFQEVVSHLHENSAIDQEILEMGSFDAQFAQLLSATSRHEFKEAVVELEQLTRCSYSPLTVGSIETGKLMLARELMGQNEYETALDILCMQEFVPNRDIHNPSHILEMAIERSICYQKLGKLPLSINELSKVINSEYALSTRVQAALLRAELYMEMGRPDLCRKQLKAVKKKGGQWAILAEEKLCQLNGTLSISD